MTVIEGFEIYLLISVFTIIFSSYGSNKPDVTKVLSFAVFWPIWFLLVLVKLVIRTVEYMKIFLVGK